MCGIGGVLSLGLDRAISEETLHKMNRVIKHRGPDATSIWRDGPIGLVHRRLSIIDLNVHGTQPFFSLDNRYTIVFNGEIYNYQELRQYLSNRGIKFHTYTDTEVLLNLFIEEREKALERLNGMFAFAIWDNKSKELFAARDRMGVKPFYYSNTHDNFIFASEQKAIFNSGLLPELDSLKLEELLLFRFVAGEETLFKNVKRLLPGHYLKIKNKTIQITRWWNLSDKALVQPKINNPYQWFEETFDSSIGYRMISDVPVGILLSGGLDSSSVAASVSLQGHKNISSYTVAFDQVEYNEGPLAKIVANKFGYQYHELKITGFELMSDLEESSWFHDEPLAHQNDAHLYAISRYAKQHVSVLLSGEGSDELMGGYVRYKPLQFHHQLSILLPLIKLMTSFNKSARFRKLNSLMNLSLTDQVLYNACSEYPNSYQQMGLSFSERFPYREKVLLESKLLYPNNPMRQSMYLDQHTFICSLLDRNDRMTMGASIECREPFLDYRLIERIASLPNHVISNGKKGKYLLYNTFGKKLPREIRKFKKWGFGVPWGSYLQSNPLFKERLRNIHKCEFFQMGIFEVIDVKTITKQYLKGDVKWETLIRQLFMMEIWYNTYFGRLQK